MTVERDQRRMALRQRSDCVFVQEDEFRRLLVARHRLLRSDDLYAHLLGLLDPSTGRRYLIERERLQ